MTEANEGGASWYGVRCIFATHEIKPWGPYQLDPGVTSYEERVTIWRATGMEAAIALAEIDAAEYAEALECEYLGLAQCFSFDGEPRQGTEVFSLIRDSKLPPDEYIEAFFETGTEYQTDVADDE